MIKKFIVKQKKFQKNLKDFHIQPYLKFHAYPKMEPLKAKQLNQSYINLMKHQAS